MNAFMQGLIDILPAIAVGIGIGVVVLGGIIIWKAS